MSISRRDPGRRDVLRGALAATALGLAHSACSKTRSGPAAPPPPPPVVKKRILILGGTGFLGPKTIAAAVGRGHEVTIFNRGKREQFLPLEFEVEHLYGNRDPGCRRRRARRRGPVAPPRRQPQGLEQLAGRTWDAVIDNSGHFRAWSRPGQLLAKSGQYTISSIGYGGGRPRRRQNASSRPIAIHRRPWAPSSRTTAGSVLCEQAAAAAFPAAPPSCAPATSSGPAIPAIASPTG
jgi:2'-hydroxyisoflavone reductase